MRSALPSGRPVELAWPSDGRTPSRGLVVIPDIGGLRPLFDQHAARLADEHGWAVAAVEPWMGDDQQLTLEERLVSVDRIDDAAFLADLGAAADRLDVEPVGITGFCMGGMYTLKAAGTGRFHRAAAFYGMIRVPEHWRGPTNVEPLDAIASSQACPAIAFFGSVDQWTPADDIDALRTAGVECVVYDGADHGFAHDASRPSHRADDAADAFRRAGEFLGA